MTKVGFGLVLGVMALGCSKAEPPRRTEPSATAAPAESVTVAAPAVTAASRELAPSVAVAEPAASAAPASFASGTKETIGAAVGLGCEAKSLDGWLQLLCRKKNGTGGHPVRALVRGGEAPPSDAGREPGSDAPDAEAPQGQELTPNDQGELVMVVPFSGSEQRDVTIEWTDTSYTLHVTGAKATLEWAGSVIPHRRACQQLLDENKALLTAAQKAEGEARLTTIEAAKLTRFGVCQPGGLGSFALSLKAVSGKGEGASRAHHLELEVVRIDLEGGRKSASFGSIDAAPGGFEVSALQVYDYDDDGRDELIVPYELKTGPGATPQLPAPIWSFNDSGLVAYAKAPTVNGGIGVEQLDFDMRPDFSGYGPYAAFLAPDCGAKSCPSRLTGPKLFWHSVADGSFTERDEATRAAFKRASCPSKPATVVVEGSGSVNVAQTGKNLVCARAFGATEDVIAAELTAKHAALCGEAATCPLESALRAWAKLAPPFELAQATTSK